MKSLKTQKIICTLLCTLLLTSCHDCTITVLQEPELFDCPALSLNLGAACDDGNPDTSDDTVGDDCLCVGTPVNNCPETIVVMRATVENNEISDLFLDRAERVPLADLNFTELSAVTGSPIQAGEAFPFQFSTINAAQNRYFYGFQYGEDDISNPLLRASTDGAFSPSFLLSAAPYAAPVFQDGELYAIDVVYDDPTAAYTILRIDQETGQLITLISGNAAVNSQVVNPVFSSVANGDGKVAFLAGTSLFEYDVNLNAVTHVVLDANDDPDMPVTYTGLEYQASANRLLVLRHQRVGMNIETNLTAISQDGLFSQTELLPVPGFLLFQDGGILHATAYAQCSEHYYITAPVAPEADVFESFLIQIDVPLLELQQAIFDDFLFGVEVD